MAAATASCKRGIVFLETMVSVAVREVVVVVGKVVVREDLLMDYMAYLLPLQQFTVCLPVPVEGGC